MARLKRAVIIKLFLCICIGVVENVQLLLANTERKNLTCVSNNYENAIAWITRVSEEYSNIIGHDSIIDVGANYTVVNEGLVETRSYKGKFGPILDYVWESFPIVFTKGVSLNSNFKFKQLAEIRYLKKFEINLSILAKDQIHIYLCKSADMEMCYWIILGGWDGTQNALRNCTQGVPWKSNAKNNCVDLHKIKAKNPFSLTSWNHITISHDGNVTFKVLHKGETILNCTISTDQMVNYSFIHVHSYFHDAFWKYHDYMYSMAIGDSISDKKIVNQISTWILVTADLCISFFAKHDAAFKLILKDRSQERWSKMYKTAINKSTWNFYTLYVERKFLETGYYMLYMEINPNDVIYFRNLVQHPNCRKQEVDFRSSSIQYKGKNGDKLECTSLEENHVYKIQQVKQEVKLNLPSEDFKKLNSFTQLQQNDFQMICERDLCYCAIGRTGGYCNSDCPHGKFGYGCFNQCFGCWNDYCTSTDGKCLNGCKNNFATVYCNETDLPVLTTIAEVSNDCIDQCKLKIYSDTLQYIGRRAPKYYSVRLYKNQQTIPSELIPISQKEYTLINLQKSTSYIFSIVLWPSQEEKFDGSLMSFTLNTTCKAIKASQIQTESVDRCIRVKVVDFDEALHCDLSRYWIEIKDKSKNIIGYKYLKKDEEICSNNFKYFTNYTFRVYTDKEVIVDTTILTDEGCPGKVLDINQIYLLDPNKISLEWKEPKPVHGRITKYTIKYSWSKIGCTSANSAQTSIEKSTNVPNIILKDLQPYSRYTVVITAFTKKGGGPETNHIATTLASSNFESSKLQVNVKPLTSRFNITFSLDCDSWNGPIHAQANATCKSEWCKGQSQSTTSEISETSSMIDLKNVHPFTQYEIQIFYHREQTSLMNGKELFKGTYTTKTAKPNKVSFLDVYSKDSSSVSLRWTAPYPPTGILDTFQIKYSYYTFLKGTVEKVLNDSTPCKIWKDFYCITLNKLTASKYTISVGAANVDVPKWGETLTIYNIYPGIEYPEAPLNLEGTWRETQDLVLQWQHPNRTNGPLRQFLLYINQQPRTFTPITLALNYTFETNTFCTTRNHYVDVALRTENNKYTSIPVRNRFTCPTFKPELVSEPSIRELGNRSFRIFLPNVKNAEEKCTLKVVVQNYNEGPPCTDLKTIQNENQRDFKCVEIFKHSCANATSVERSMKLANQSALNFETDEYGIYIVLINEYNGQESTNVYDLNRHINPRGGLNRAQDESSSTWWIILLVIFTILVILGLGFVVYKRKDQLAGLLFKPVESEAQPDLIPLAYQLEPSTSTASPIVKPLKVEHLNPSTPKKLSRIINVNDLNDYLKDAIVSGELDKQHEQFPRGVQKATTCGEHQANIKKNRYKNLIAYDDTRVVLQMLPNDDKSDYINANYINSPFCSKAYIATQGPKDSTIIDFWRMIVQEGIETIVMLANVIENGKPKVEKYWPEVKTFQKSIQYGDITVTATEIHAYSNYEVRQFTVSHQNAKQNLTQYHFTAWPDHGVPIYVQSLLPFVETISKIKHNSQHPILVHCSAGVGRTGTIILIDICLRLGQRDHCFDAFHQLHLLREQRANLVDNVEQYKLVHMVLLEFFHDPRTTYPCDASLANITDVELINQLRYVETSAWQEDVFKTPRGKFQMKIDPTKNRSKDIVPGRHGCIYLRPLNEDGSTYINAVCVDSFHEMEKFIATQHPLANTVGDFWRLVDEREVNLIISLQADYDTPFWQPENDFTPEFNLTVTHTASEPCEGFTMQSLEFKRRQKEPKMLQMIELSNWKVKDALPKDVHALLEIWRRMDKLNWKGANILVMCRDGANACGLFIAMCYMLERIKTEQVCDVCRAVRSIRRSRKQFVTNFVQFRTLYRLSALYLSEFVVYSNFKS